MNRRQVIAVGSCLWAAIGAAIALTALHSVNADAVALVGAASLLGPLAALAAARLVLRGKDPIAGALLLVSVLTPTYFAWVLNVPSLIVGLALAIAPGATLGRPDKARVA